jgi:hypothetical protein
MTGFLDFLKNVPQILPPWLSAIFALGSLLVATRSVRLAIRESRGKAEQAEKYTKTLEAVIEYSKFLQKLEEYGQYLQRLQGVEQRVGSVADQLGEIARRVTGAVEASASQITKSMESMADAARAADEIAGQLREIGQVAVLAQQAALRSQRDSVKAHERLLKDTRYAPRKFRKTDIVRS